MSELTSAQVTGSELHEPGLAGRDDRGLQRQVAELLREIRRLTESEARYRMVAENASDAAFSATADAVFTWVSPSVKDLLGWEPEQVVGMRPTDLVHPDDLPEMRARVAAVSQGAAVDFRARFRTAGNGYRWLGATVRPVMDAAGRVVARVGTWRNVQAEIDAAEALRAERDRSTAVLDSMLDPHITVAPVMGEDGVRDWVFASLNSAACLRLRTTRQAVIGTSLLDVFTSSGGQMLRNWCEQVAITGAPVELNDTPMHSSILQADRRFDVRAVRVGDQISLTWRDVTDRWLTANRVAASQAKLRLLLDTMAEGVMVYDANGRVTEANPAAQRIVEMDREQMAGKQFKSRKFRLVRPDGSPFPDTEHPVAVCLATGKPVAQSVIGMYRPDESLIWLQSTAEPLPGPDGHPAGVVATFSDITALIEAEQALRRSEDQYRVLAERGTDVVFRGTNAAVLQWLSPSITRTLGWQPDDMVGHSIAEFIHPSDIAAMREASRNANQGSPVTYRARLRHADGSWVWMEVCAEPILDENGEIAGRVGSARDVSAQVAAEQALLLSEELFRTALQSAAAGICLIDPTGTVLRVNPSLCNILGRAENDLLGGNWRDWQVGTPGEEAAHEVQMLADLIEGRRDSSRLQKRLVRPDGHILYAQVSLGCVRNPDGTARHLVAQIVDVTAEHRQQQELVAQRAQLRATLDAELDPHVTLTAVRDDAGRIIDFNYSNPNRAALAYLQLGPEQLIGARMSELYPAAAAADLRSLLAAALDRGTPIDIDGYVYPDMFGVGERVFDLRGALVGDAISFSWRDVTERHKLAAALAESERRYRLLAEHSGDVVVSADASGVMTYVSPAAFAVLGRTPESLVGMRMRDLIHPDDAPVVAAARPKLWASQGQAGRVRARLRCADGSYRWLDSVSRGVVDENGQLVGGVATWRDVQAEVEAEQALARSREKFRLLAHNATDVVYRMSPDGILEWVSESVQRLLGYPWDEVVGRTGLDFVHPEDRAQARQVMTQVLAGQRSTVRMRLLRKDGAALWTEITGHPTCDATGALTAVSGRWRNVDAEHRAGVELEAERARLAAVLSSELEPHVYLEAIRNSSGTIVDFVYRDVNDAACAYLGMARADIEGARVLELLPGQAGSGMLAMYADAVESGQPLMLDDYVYPHEILASERRYDIRAVRVGDGLSFAWRDVTERHEITTALAESEQQFRLLAENAADVVMRLDASNRVLWTSPSAQRLLGIEPGTLLGPARIELIHPEDLPKVQAAVRALRVGRVKAVTQELRLRRTDCEFAWWQVTARRSEDLPGPADLVLSLRDIDAEIRARDLAQSEQQRRAAAVQSMIDPHLLLRVIRDDEGSVEDFTIADANDAACQAFQLRPDELVGTRGRNSMSGLSSPGILDALIGATMTGLPLVLDDAAYMSRLGTRTWVDLRAVHINPEAVSVTWRDVTDRHEAAQKLAASEARYRLLADNAGDIVAEYDPSGRFTYLSPAVTRLLGWAPEELLGTHPGRLLHPDDLQVAAEIRAATRGPVGVGSGQFRVRCKSGSYRWIASVLREIRDPDSIPLASVDTWRDIQAEKAARDALDRSQRRFSLMFAEHHAIMLLIDPTSGAIVDANAAAERFYGFSKETLQSMNIADINITSTDEQLRRRLEAVAGVAEAFVFQHRLADGTIRNVEAHASPIYDEERTLLFSIVRDITEDLAAREALAASEARFRLLADNVGDIVVELDLNGILTYVSPSVAHVLGWQPHQLLGTALLKLVHPRDRSQAIGGLGASRDAADGISSARVRMRRTDGTYRWIGGVVREVRHPDGTPWTVVAALRDIQSEVEAEELLQQQATTDALTGLINRRELISRVEELLNPIPSTGTGLAILFIDLDNLKPINDTYGHAAGDAAIATSAARLRKAVREEDLVARIGGDEFVVVLTSVASLKRATKVAEKLHRRIAVPISNADVSFSLTVSIGLTVLQPGDDLPTALGRADAALYRAKQQGRAQTVVFHPDQEADR